MSILDFIIFLPLAAAIAIGFGLPARRTALAAAGLNLLLGFIALARFGNHDPASGPAFAASRTVSQNPEIAWAVGLDGMSLVLLLLTVLVTFAALWQAATPKDNVRLFYISLLLISAGSLGAFLTTDLFFLYAFHELALIPTFLLIGIFGKGDRRAAAWKITIYLAAGSLVLLAGLLLLVISLGQGGVLTFDLAALAQRAAAQPIGASSQSLIYLLLLIGFGTLVSLFPLHSWAAPAYASAPTPAVMLHAGVLKKFGLYGLLRLSPLLPAGAERWLSLLLILLLGNILFVGLVTLSQKRLDSMLAHSSVMHMGYIFLGIAAFQPGHTLGATGAVLLMFAHGLSIALLFALAGRLEDKLGTLDMTKLGGLGKITPRFAFLFGLAAFASIGLPGFANFTGEILVFLGGFQSHEPGAPLGGLQIATILAVWGVVISAVYMLRAYRAIFLGELTESNATASLTDLTLSQKLPAGLLAAGLLAIGIYPWFLQRFLQF